MTGQNNLVLEYRQLREKIRERLFASLNPEQMKAVEAGDGPVLCLAGAGSGKTTAMVYRILHLCLFGSRFERCVTPPPGFCEQDLQLMRGWLAENEGKEVPRLPERLVALLGQDGVKPSRIMAITFTNKAAQEMQTRLSAFFGEARRDMWVMTFHAACVRILRREIAALGYNSGFTIYDDHDQLQVVKGVARELDLDEKKYPYRMLLSIINNYKCELITPSEAKKHSFDQVHQTAATVYERYQKELSRNNALDFDDLIMLTVRLFKEYPDILAKYEERFHYLLVDEYQDTNHAQYVLVNMLSRKRQNLCVVGDDDQSIYAFRQADVRNILEFERDYPKARVIKLEQNYRSTQLILNAANEVISHNKKRKEKKLWTENPEGELITVYEACNEQDEARFISDRIARLAEKDKRYSDCAVLIRTNAQSRVLEDWFRKRGIPYIIVGGQKFYERLEIKDVMAYLRVLANSGDSISLKRIINVPRRGIGEATIQKAEEYSRLHGLSLYDALRFYPELNLGGKVSRGIKEFLEIMDALSAAAEESAITVLTRNILEMTGYLAELEKENTYEAQSRIENLEEFLTVTQEYDRQADWPSLHDFLSQMALVTDLDSYEDETEAAVIMTMHMAKGLEFTSVFLAGMEEGIFPHSRSLLDESELEEERRLCYVALTRAKKRVFLVYARQRNLYGKLSRNLPSRFLGEIPAPLWQEYREKPGFFTTTLSPSVKDRSLYGGWEDGKDGEGAESREGWEPFLLGEKVEHNRFGQGVVVGIKGAGEDTELTIAFPGQGLKTLLTKYAPLRKVN